MTKRWVAYKVRIKDLVNSQFTEDGAKVGNILVNRARILGSVVSKFLGPEDKYAFIIVDDGTETIRVRGFEDTVPLIKKINPGEIVDVIGRVRKYEDEIYIVPEIIKKITNPNWEILRKIELLVQEKNPPKQIEQKNSEGAPSEEIIEEEIIETEPANSSDSGLQEVSEPASSSDSGLLDSSKPAGGFDIGTAGSDYAEPGGGRFLEVSEPGGGSDRKRVIKAIIDMDKGEGVDVSYLFDKIGLSKQTVLNILKELMNEGSIFEPRPGKIKLLE